MTTVEPRTYAAKAKGERGSWVYWLAVALASLVLLGATGFAIERGWQLRKAIAEVESLIGQRNPVGQGIVGLIRDASGGLVDVGRGAARLEVMQAQVAQLHAQSMGLFALVMFSVLLFVVVPTMGRRGHRDTSQHLLLASLPLLALGLWAPLLTVTLHLDVPLLGRVVADSTTKGLLDTVLLFIRGDQPVLGLLLLLFCVIFPIAKSALLQVLILSDKLNPKTAEHLSYLGKLSMTDVFVAAMTLVIFAFSSNAASDAAAGVGLYFFAGYCVVSMVTSIVLERQAKMERQRTLPIAGPSPRG
jgi:paraquat-inducible protein A